MNADSLLWLLAHPRPSYLAGLRVLVFVLRFGVPNWEIRWHFRATVPNFFFRITAALVVFTAVASTYRIHRHSSTAVQQSFFSSIVRTGL